MTTAPPSGSGAMFDAIADRYDLLNRIISLGVDRRWRARTVAALAVDGEARVLDLATGTGDLAIAIAEAHRSARVIGVDPSERMLAVGRQKVERAALSDRVQLIEGDAQALPFDDASFDATSIAFGIRNVPDRDRGLREMARVTKPRGRVVVLELSEPRDGVMASLARFHVHNVVPSVGAFLSGAREYQYLARSIEAFPPAEEFAARMEAAGLDIVAVTPMTFGACTLYVSARRAA